MYKRYLQLDLPKGQSTFLWGARQTGKSSWLQAHFPDSAYFDLLRIDNLMRFQRQPGLFREEVLALPEKQLQLPVIIDGVQKLPILLNEVHTLIENKKINFILCGSSARQLKMKWSNLLGGRAWVEHFFPLVYPEIPDFDLLRALQHGLLPTHYLTQPTYLARHLQAYVDVYLVEEIRNEGLVRNLTGFARFLDISGLCNGELINANNIARDCGVDRSTVQSYFQILVDTMLGYYVHPYHKKVKRDLIHATPKFYLFDVGIANYLAKSSVLALSGAQAGKSFEHYIFMELYAYLSLHHHRDSITYWRTKQGLEVDFIIGDAQLAIEVKISNTVHLQDLKGLVAFIEEHPHTQALVISLDPKRRVIELDAHRKITIMPWREFLSEWWSGHIFSGE